MRLRHVRKKESIRSGFANTSPQRHASGDVAPSVNSLLLAFISTASQTSRTIEELIYHPGCASNSVRTLWVCDYEVKSLCLLAEESSPMPETHHPSQSVPASLSFCLWLQAMLFCVSSMLTFSSSFDIMPVDFRHTRPPCMNYYPEKSLTPPWQWARFVNQDNQFSSACACWF